MATVSSPPQQAQQAQQQQQQQQINELMPLVAALTNADQVKISAILPRRYLFVLLFLATSSSIYKLLKKYYGFYDCQYHQGSQKIS